MADSVLAKINRVNTALAEVWTIQESGQVIGLAEAAIVYTKRVDASVDTKNQASELYLRARRLRGQWIKKMPKAKPPSGKGQKKHDRRVQNEPDGPPTLADLGISKKAADEERKLATIPEAKFEQLLTVEEGKELDAKATIATVRREQKRVEVVANLEDVSVRKAKAAEGVYDVLVIDPPWPMEKIERDERPNQSEFDYPTMTEETLLDPSIWYGKKLPAASACHIWLWTTHKFLPMAFRLLEAWGLKYVCCFVWHKAGGFQPQELPQYNCEFALYARKGSPKFIDTKAFDTCFNGKRGKHSEKPTEFYDTIRRVTAGRRLDMFSRRSIEGFDSWGQEAMP